jgi:hypothetical protein
MTDTANPNTPYTLLEQQLNEMARRMALDVNSMEEFVSTGKTALLKAIDDNKDEVNTFITGKTSEINSVISGMQSDAEEVLTELQTDNSAAVAAINTAAETQRAQIQSQVDNLVAGLTGSDYEAVFVAELNKTEEE